MADLVADTHAIIWHLTEPERLGRAARRAFAAADAGRLLCHVPAVTLVEIWLLYERGRLRIGPSQVLDALSPHAGYAVLPLDIEQALAFGALTGLRDPFDRMIVAAARATGSKLVSADEGLDEHATRVWD